MLLGKLKKISRCGRGKKPGYEILVDDVSKHGLLSGPRIIRKIRCKQCGSVSYNQEDVRYLYCARCGIFHTK